MRKLIRKTVLGTASVLAFCVGGAALDYAADPGSAPAAEEVSSIAQPSENLWPSAGIRKDDVRWAQIELRDRGLYKGSLDGILGPQTERALGQFQQNNDLTRTASLDTQTWDALTGSSGVGEGSSKVPNSDRPGSTANPAPTGDLGR